MYFLGVISLELSEKQNLDLPMKMNEAFYWCKRNWALLYMYEFIVIIGW